MHLKHISLAAAFAAVAVAQDQSLSETLAGNEQLSSLADYLNTYQDLMQQLDGASNITVLAPSNDAFEQLTQEMGNSSSRRRRFMKRQDDSDDSQDDNNQDEGSSPGADDIQALLSYHVVNGAMMSDQVTEDPMFVPTMLDSEDYTQVTGGQVVQIMMDGQDVKIISGFLSESVVTEADIEFSGGVIHIIDTVLTIPENAADTAIAAGLSALAGAIDTAGLSQDIESTSDLTIFAPSNDAFEAIGSAVGELSQDDLASLLQYHVVEGNIGYSTDLSDGDELDAMSGDQLMITVKGADVYVNSAKVIIMDVLVSNGVVHVIDAVLNPDMTDPPTKSATEGMVAFPDATSASLDITSNVPEATTTISVSATGGSGGNAQTASSEELGARATAAVGMAALFGAAGAAMMV